MRRVIWLLIVMVSLSLAPTPAQAKGPMGSTLQAGLGMGTVSPYPLGASFPYALQAVLEGTYKWKTFGLSILGTATSSTAINGTYYFGNQGGGYQTFLEPRLYVSIFKLGVAVGMNLSNGTSGTIQSVVSYGPMVGVELPIGPVSLGVDARYIQVSSQANPAPLSIIGMFRFRI